MEIFATAYESYLLNYANKILNVNKKFKVDNTGIVNVDEKRTVYDKLDDVLRIFKIPKNILTNSSQITNEEKLKELIENFPIEINPPELPATILNSNNVVFVDETTLIRNVDHGFENKSDHALIYTNLTGHKIASWNLMNEDNEGSVIHTSRTLYGEKGKQKQFLDILKKANRVDTIISYLSNTVLKEDVDGVDIVCLQEVGPVMHGKITTWLNDKKDKYGYISTLGSESDVNIAGQEVKEYRITIYSKKQYELNNHRVFTLFVNDKCRKNMLWCRLQKTGSTEMINIVNTHLYHSANINVCRKFIDDVYWYIYSNLGQVDEKVDEKVVFIGDFNNKMNFKMNGEDKPLFNTMYFPTQPTFISRMKSVSGYSATNILDGVLVVEQYNQLLVREIDAYKALFLDAFELFHVYCKGGSVLGIRVLQQILEISKHDDTSTLYADTKHLIKDFDFTFIPKAKKGCTKLQIINFMLKHPQFVSEAQSMFIYRHVHQKQFYDKSIIDKFVPTTEALLEVSIKETELGYSDLEIPLTSMKIEMTKNNINQFFDFILKWDKEEYGSKTDEMIHGFIIENQKTDINGLFDVDKDRFDDGGLHRSMLDVIKNTSKDINTQQFLVSQITQPDRLFTRLREKNFVKSEKIKSLYEKHSYSAEGSKLLLNTEYLDEIIERYLNLLKQTIVNSYDTLRLSLLNVEMIHNKSRNLIEFIKKNKIPHNSVSISEIKDIKDYNENIVKIESFIIEHNKKIDDYNSSIYLHNASIGNEISKLKNLKANDHEIQHLNQQFQKKEKPISNLFDCFVKNCKDLTKIVRVVQNFFNTEFQLFQNVNIGRLSITYDPLYVDIFSADKLMKMVPNLNHTKVYAFNKMTRAFTSMIEFVYKQSKGTAKENGYKLKYLSTKRLYILRRDKNRII